MTREGHTLSAWITFSAGQEGDMTIAQGQTLERPSDPLDELACVLGGNRLNDRFWRETLTSRAHHLGLPSRSPRRKEVCRQGPPLAARGQRPH